MEEYVESNRRLAAAEGILSGGLPLADSLSLFMVQAVIILSICRVLALIGLYLKQPKVIFEIIGGILLGPSAIGRNKTYLNKIFPTSSLPLLSIVANVGLVLYLFVVGMELDPVLLASHARKAGGIAFVGMAVPFCLGIAISKTMMNTLQGDDPAFKDVDFTSYYVFIGTALSITAFPVLARILKESGLIYTTAGAMTMGAAALNDAAAWCLLILAISMANAGNMSTAGYVFLCVCAFALVLFFAVRPVYERIVYFVESFDSPGMNNYLFAFTLVILFLCAWTTALLGVHAIFGAFLFGLIVPRKTHIFKECNDKIEELVLTLMLPLYFALSGLKTDVTQIQTREEGAMVVLVCVVATLGKYIGAGGTALLSGISYRESAVIAVLMNTRGLIELIVLNLGVQSGILSTRTFSVMVIMCLFTTFITCPCVDLIYPEHVRIRADHKFPAIGEEEAEDSLLQEEGGDIEGGPSTQVSSDVVNLERLVKSARLGVLVDRMEHFQGLMDLLACFSPISTADFILEVTAIKIHEPSLTDKDHFIGLDERGKLVYVEEEPTHMIAIAKPGSSPEPPQELLPMSMFLKAVGAKVTAYRIRGDPSEFPESIRKIAENNQWDVTFFPWRPSQFVERLFWGSARTFVHPIALIVQVDPEAATRARSYTNYSDGAGEIRPRRDTLRGQPGVDYATPIPTSEAPLSDSGISTPPSTTADLTAPQDSSPVSRPHRDIPPVMSRMRALSASAPTFQFQSISDGLSAVSNPIKTVLGIITGSTLDPLIFPFLLRFAERKSIRVAVLVTSDVECFPVAVRHSLEVFRSIATSSGAIDIINSSCSSRDTRGLTNFCSMDRFDLIMIGFVMVPSSINDPTESSYGSEPQTRTHRSATLSAQIAQTLGAPTPLSTIEWRRKIGVPESIASSPLAHPELGELGSAIYDECLGSFLIVLHNPVLLHSIVGRGIGARKATLWSFGDDLAHHVTSDKSMNGGTLAVIKENEEEKV